MKKNNHAVSNTLFGVGAAFTFFGFGWPGWWWVLRTPGDVEMLPLAAITIVGITGILTVIAGGIRRVRESSKENVQKKE